MKRFQAGGPTDDNPPPGRMTLTPAERRLERQTGIAAQQLNRDIPTYADDSGEAQRLRLQTPNSRQVYATGTSSFAKGGKVKNYCKGGKVISSKNF